MDASGFQLNFLSSKAKTHVSFRQVYWHQLVSRFECVCLLLQRLRHSVVSPSAFPLEFERQSPSCACFDPQV